MKPFVPSGSAPAEIVADPRLTWDNAVHAVNVIDNLMRDEAKYGDVRRHLMNRSKKFSVEGLIIGANKIVEEVLEVNQAVDS